MDDRTGTLSPHLDSTQSVDPCIRGGRSGDVGRRRDESSEEGGDVVGEDGGERTNKNS